MMNNSVLIGRLTKDPELRNINDGTAVASFTLAVTRKYNKNETDFINCQAWRKTAELLTQYCKKGSLVGIEGRIQTRNYEGQDGKRVYVTEVVAESVEFLDSKNTNSNDDGQTLDISDDDLPF
ncbi:single-stranded DNA-binding protein [Cytobacillus sp. IB215665]|uniref:single-stranded DNA-binding protein n=1 Tax=Cytobacillus sp. IB215665 TaxID=3097357 RepID=UPI002A146860|nr:single-stranded DNA-binding protein [Cytobacillus sp. IB215665]MDX8367897.1 single-stranded DNA-binding protein [Cytobacillus sp. IB215665]